MPPIEMIDNPDQLLPFIQCPSFLSEASQKQRNCDVDWGTKIKKHVTSDTSDGKCGAMKQLLKGKTCQ